MSVLNSFSKTIDDKLRQWDDIRKDWQIRLMCRLVSWCFLRNEKTPNLDVKQLRKVLFLRHDNKIGDMIVSTVIYRNLKVCRPDIEIHVVTGAEGAQVLQENDQDSQAVSGGGPAPNGWPANQGTQKGRRL